MVGVAPAAAVRNPAQRSTTAREPTDAPAAKAASFPSARSSSRKAVLTRSSLSSSRYSLSCRALQPWMCATVKRLGSYHKTAATETFMSHQHAQHPCDIADLAGSRLVTAVETADGS